MKWLRDSLGLIKDASETGELAQSVEDNGDVYFVPAFSGLFAPYWETSARGYVFKCSSSNKGKHFAICQKENNFINSRC